MVDSNDRNMTDYEYRIGCWVSAIAVILYGLLVLIGQLISA